MFFGLRVVCDILFPARQFPRLKGNILPLSLAQITGITVAFVYGFGSDLDLVFAVPVGLLAGVVAELVSSRLALAAARVRTR
jgi:hypothetical protein